MQVPDGCETLGASFWIALCQDGTAYSSGDSRRCGTVYCMARFEGRTACEGIDSNSTGWVSHRRRACMAWAARTPYLCEGLLKSGDCFRWYALLDNDLNLCMKARNNPGDDCLYEFSFWRGNVSVCEGWNTGQKRAECEAGYWQMEAWDSMEKEYCRQVRFPAARQRCEDLALHRGERHPLFGIEKELI